MCSMYFLNTESEAKAVRRACLMTCHYFTQAILSGGGGGGGSSL